MTRIILTPGEPAGIGPDILIKLAQQQLSNEIIAIADPQLLLDRAHQLKLKLEIIHTDLSEPSEPVAAGQLKVFPVTLKNPVTPGELDVANARYVMKTLQIAADLCLENQDYALVTGPVHKAILNVAGCNFSGHTEYFAQASDIDRVVMMLATPTLRVALATTHVPLANVAKMIKSSTLEQTITIINNDLSKRLNIKKPKILVCGLNPHAGENGFMGKEEIEVIIPVVDKMKRKGLNIDGPVSADTAFTKKSLQDVDVVLSMYHDQGLPVIKSLGFGNAANVTLGLPFVRTSVDHGTALDLAGTGKASESSLKAAIDVAVSMNVQAAEVL